MDLRSLSISGRRHVEQDDLSATNWKFSPLERPSISLEDDASSFQRVPTETWSEIFRIVCFSGTCSGYQYDSLYPKQPQWVLLQVCSQWRRIIESLPEIWAGIRIGPSAAFFRTSPDKVLWRLARNLKNSGHAPLSIDVDLTVRHLMLKIQPDGPAALRDMRQRILDLLVIHHLRWACVYFRGHEHSLLKTMLAHFQAQGDSTPEFPELIHFHHSRLRRDEYVSLANSNIAPRFPKLRSLVLKDQLEMEGLPAFFSCAQLEDVEIDSARAVFTLIPHFTSATQITLLQEWPTEPSDNFDDDAEVVRLVNLKELMVSHWPRDMDEWPLQFLAPCLTILKIDGIKEDEDLLALIHFLEESDCQLEELHIHHLGYTEGDLEMRRLLYAIPQCKVLNLGFGVDEEDDDYYGLTWAEYFNPEDHLLWAECANDFVQCMAEREDNGRGRYAFCPQLENLQIQLYKFIGLGDGAFPEIQTTFDFAAFADMAYSRWQDDSAYAFNSSSTPGSESGSGTSTVSGVTLRAVRLVYGGEPSVEERRECGRLEDCLGLDLDLHFGGDAFERLTDWMSIYRY